MSFKRSLLATGFDFPTLTSYLFHPRCFSHCSHCVGPVYLLSSLDANERERNAVSA